MPRPRKPYSGVLRRRLPDPDTDVWWPAYLERLDALYAHFEIDRTGPGAKDLLIFALTHAHIDGFQIAKKSGRKPKPQQTERDVILIAQIGMARIAGKPKSTGTDASRKNGTSLRRRCADASRPCGKEARRQANDGSISSRFLRPI